MHTIFLKKIWLGIWFMGVMLMMVQESRGANIIQNPSFEEADLAAYHNAVWNGTATLSLSNDQAHAGQQSLKIVGTNASATVWQVINVQPNKNYTASVWLKTSGLSGAGKTGLEIKSNAAYYYLSADQQPNDNAWHQVSVNFNTGTATELTIICAYEMYGNGTGTAWFDELTLVNNDFTPPVLPNPPYSLTFGTGPNGKQGFFLNGSWINPVVLTRALPAPTPGEITQFKADGINMLYLPIKPGQAASADVTIYLTRCREGAMPVIVEYNTAMWDGWLQESPARNMGLSPNYPGGKTRVQYFPDYASSEVKSYVQNEINMIVNALKNFHHSPVIAYSIGAYDFYHLPDGETHNLFNTLYPHPLGEGRQTWLPYGTPITTDFQQFLTSRGVNAADLGFSILGDVTTPTDKASARNDEHWRWWILYRREYVHRHTAMVIGAFKNAGDLPVTGSFDLNFSLNENFATPLPSAVDLYDFFILYYYGHPDYPPGEMVPGLLETAHASLNAAGKSAFSMFEFSSQIGAYVVPIADYLDRSLPYVAGFQYQYQSSLYNAFLSRIQAYDREQRWNERPTPAQAALFLSPDEVYHWEKGLLSGRFLLDQHLPYDVIYDYAAFNQYPNLYIIPKQPVFLGSPAAKAALQEYARIGGNLLASLFDLFPNPCLANDFEEGDYVHASWISGGGQGTLVVQPTSDKAKSGAHSVLWRYTLPSQPAGNDPMFDMVPPDGNLTGLQKLGLWIYLDLTGPKTANVMNIELLRRDASSINLGMWNAGGSGVPNRQWIYHEWSVPAGADLSDVTYLRFYHHAGDGWAAVAPDGQVPIFLDDLTLRFPEKPKSSTAQAWLSLRE